MIKNKYVKVFYNINNINLTDVQNGSTFDDLILFNNFPSTYKFVFKIRKDDGSVDYFDLSDLSSYLFVYKDDNGVENRIDCTYSKNMNLSLGELEFNLTKKHIDKMMNSQYEYFDIVVVNADGSNSLLYEGNYSFKN